MYPKIKRGSAGTTAPRCRKLAELTRQVTPVRAAFANGAAVEAPAFAILDRTTLARA